jgi:hypothetical protein
MNNDKIRARAQKFALDYFQQTIKDIADFTHTKPPF